MSERAQALEAALRELTAIVRGECPSLLNEDSGGDARLSIEIDALLAAPPVGVSPQPDLRDTAERLLAWAEARVAEDDPWPPEIIDMRAELAASLSPVEPTPDAQVCVWREGEWDYESGCRGTQISRDERSSGPPDGWKHCPYCGKRLELGTAPQGGEQ